MRGWLRCYWPALALAALALALRCYGLTAPLLDYHSWRQADTAAIARNYAVGGYRLLYPQVDWGGSTPGYVESEFPLYTYTLALLYGLLGVREWLGRLLTALAGAAAVAALYGAAAAPLGRRAALYAGLALALMPFTIYFGRAVMPDTWMLLASILAIWTFRRWLERPTTVRFAVALACGTLAPLAKTPNLLIVAVPLAYLAWVERPPRRHWPALACYAVCFALPSLLWLRHAQTLPLDPRLSFGVDEKLFVLRLLLDPQFYLLLARWNVDNLITLAGLPFFVLGVSPWSVARSPLHPATGDRRPTTDDRRQGDKACPERSRRETRRQGEGRQTTRSTQRTTDNGQRAMGNGGWKGSSWRSSILHVPSSIFGGRWSVVGGRHPVGWLGHFWLLGVLLFFCAAAAGVVGQDYYILPLAAPAAWFIGAGLDRAQRFLETDDHRQADKETRRQGDSEGATRSMHRTTDNGQRIEASIRRSSFVVRRRVDYLVPLVAFAALGWLSFERIAPLYRTSDFYWTLGRRLDLALPAEARVGVIAPATSEILYYSGRKGWRLDAGVIVPGGLASLPPDLGVRYLLVADPALTEGREVLTAALREYQRIPAGPYALLLDLARRGIRRPAAMIWETGHLLEEPFLSYWRKAGGVERLGYPLSDALDGPEGREQYFERGLLVQQGGHVRRAAAGLLLCAAQGRVPQRTEVAPPFRALWQQVGGEATLGAAISPALDDRAGGQIQYFEYGTLEAPRGGTPVLGAAGRWLLEARGLSEERQIELLRALGPRR